MDEEDTLDWHQWASEQLAGVMNEDDPRYKWEVQLVELIAADCAMMLLHDQGALHPHFASEHMPTSWAWII